jgi:hypothetical protein
MVLGPSSPGCSFRRMTASTIASRISGAEEPQAMSVMFATTQFHTGSSTSTSSVTSANAKGFVCQLAMSDKGAISAGSALMVSSSSERSHLLSEGLFA